MKRRKAREYALQMLFRQEFAGDRSGPEFPDGHDNEKKMDESLVKFARELVSGTLSHLQEIDRIVEETAENWKVERMPAVDRNILRCAVYDLMFRDDIPPAVSINEALEIAKKYSSSEASSFINGLLDKIAQTHGKTK